MAATQIPDYVIVVKPESISYLAQLASTLLADHGDLPAPSYFHVYGSGQDIRLGFGSSSEPFKALAQWAERFGGTVTAEPFTRDDGRESIHTEVKFLYQGVSVEAYAFIDAENGSAITS